MQPNIISLIKVICGIWLLSLLATGCGGGSSGSDASDVTPVESEGELTIVLRDAAEDFLTYSVDVTELLLVRSDGTRVNALPNSPRIDFAQYQQLSELFSLQTVPAGRYQQIQMTLDYSNAEITLTDDSGAILTATAVDQNGDPLADYQVTMTLEQRDALIVAPGIPASLVIDFDLEASNTLISTDPARIEVSPVLLASAEMDLEREHRIRGLLQGVEDREITVAIRPFRFHSGRFGEVILLTTEETSFEIDGETLDHEAGLMALSEMPTDTPIVALSYFDRDLRRFIASEIQAGSSVAWAGRDLLRGVIVAVEEDALLLHGAVIEPEDQAAHLVREARLLLSDQTQIVGWHDGERDTFTLDDVQVGSSIQALGQWNATGAETSPEFDATEGLVRLRISKLFGQTVANEPLTISATRINARPVESYQFEQVDPDNISIDTGALSLPEIESGDWLALRGYFDAEDSSDFTARSVTEVTVENTRLRYFAIWLPEETGVAVDGEQLLLTEGMIPAVTRIAGYRLPQFNPFVIDAVFSGDDEGRYHIMDRDNRTISKYLSFDSFLAATTQALEAGSQARGLSCEGNYREEDQSLDAGRCTLIL